jgi:hypothetical protein
MIPTSKEEFRILVDHAETVQNILNEWVGRYSLSVEPIGISANSGYIAVLVLRQKLKETKE